MTDDLKNRKPWKFFLLTFAYSWILWIPSVLDGIGVDLAFDVAGYSIVVVMIGAFAPLLSALTLVAQEAGWRGVKKFVGQAFNFRVKPVYILIALLLPLLIHIIAHYLAPLFGFEVASTLIPEDMAISPILLAFPYFLLMLVLGGGQEEFGWRGYAQEPLQQRFGVIRASLIIGVIWGLWHLPLWFMAGDLHSSYSYIAFVLMTTSLSLAYAWLYNSSGKKLIVVLFFHAMNNTAAPLLPFLHGIEGKPENAYWLYTAVNVLVGGIFAYLITRGVKPLQDNQPET